MAEAGECLSTTTSLCPECLERVDGEYVKRDEAVFLERVCPEHGLASRQVWESVEHWEWAAAYGPELDHGDDFTVENEHACLAVIEVTQECNLSCSYCFASSGPGGRELPFEAVVELLDVVLASGGPRPIQFSGGEPTVRDDLPELVRTARERGFEHIQVNTNGIMLANEPGYASELAAAGVTAIYLQFDGLESATYEAIREVDLTAIKERAIAACRAVDLPVVLVPTIVPGVNEDEMGDIVRFALANQDIVRSVNFQPVAHFGRYAEHHGRFSLDAAAECLADQLEAVSVRDLLPIPCCSAYCQLATALVPAAGDGGSARPLTEFVDVEMFDALSGMVDEADWMELLAGTSLGEARTGTIAAANEIDTETPRGCCGSEGGGACCGPEFGALDGLLEEVLPVSLTGFMDADAADAERLGNCCISVPTPSGELVPFCGYNMTTEDGEYALRNRHGWGGRRVVSDGGQASSPVRGDGRGAVESTRDSLQSNGCCGSESYGGSAE